MSTPANNTRLKTAKTAEGKKKVQQFHLQNSLKSLNEASGELPSIMKTPSSKEELKGLKDRKGLSKSVGRKKTAPKVYRMLHEDKKEELILKWLKTSKGVKTAGSAETLNADSSCDNIPSKQKQYRSAAVNASTEEEEECEAIVSENLKSSLQEDPDQSTEIVLNINKGNTQSLVSLWSETEEDTSPLDVRSIMSCQVISTGRRPKSNMFKKMITKLSHEHD